MEQPAKTPEEQKAWDDAKRLQKNERLKARRKRDKDKKNADYKDHKRAERNGFYEKGFLKEGKLDLEREEDDEVSIVTPPEMKPKKDREWLPGRERANSTESSSE